MTWAVNTHYILVRQLLVNSQHEESKCTLFMGFVNVYSGPSPVNDTSHKVRPLLILNSSELGLI